MLNQVMIQGNLTADPELMKTRTGVSVVNVRIACQREAYRPGRQNVDFVRLTFWAKEADRLCKCYRKGDTVAVVGRLEEIPRTSREGVRYNAYSIRVIQIMDPELFSEEDNTSEEESAEEE